jgi:hypothetical protein
MVSGRRVESTWQVEGGATAHLPGGARQGPQS